jgi:uncharacterized protein (DUF1697 family)
MPSFVALLRGINVGGKNLIGMPALAECFRSAGYEDVRTYLQSGNVLLTAQPENGLEPEDTLERDASAAVRDCDPGRGPVAR